MVEPILSGGPSARFNYTDDVGIIGVDKSAEEYAITAQYKVRNCLECFDRNALCIDLEKTELVQFLGWRKKSQVGVQKHNVMLKLSESIRWL